MLIVARPSRPCAPLASCQRRGTRARCPRHGANQKSTLDNRQWGDAGASKRKIHELCFTRNHRRIDFVTSTESIIRIRPKIRDVKEKGKKAPACIPGAEYESGMVDTEESKTRQSRGIEPGWDWKESHTLFLLLPNHIRWRLLSLGRCDRDGKSGSTG